jgi:hypothetical protein
MRWLRIVWLGQRVKHFQKREDEYWSMAGAQAGHKLSCIAEREALCMAILVSLGLVEGAWIKHRNGSFSECLGPCKVNGEVGVMTHPLIGDAPSKPLDLLCPATRAELKVKTGEWTIIPKKGKPE